MVKKEILFGINPVYEALRASRRDIFKVYVTKEKISKRLEGILALADSLKIPVETSDSFNLKSISGSEHHQGVGVEAGPYPFVKFQICSTAFRAKNQILFYCSLTILWILTTSVL